MSHTKGEKVRELINGALIKGNHKIDFDGKNLNSGVYYISIKNGISTQMSKKIILIK